MSYFGTNKHVVILETGRQINKIRFHLTYFQHLKSAFAINHVKAIQSCLLLVLLQAHGRLSLEARVILRYRNRISCQLT